MTTKKIEVAVIGGGIGGLCVAIGLLKHKHLNVNIYEAAHKFAEIGAGVAIGPNSQHAMALIDKSVHEAFLRQATNNGWESRRKTWFQFRYGAKGEPEEFISAPENETGQTTCHRALFLDELVKLVPPKVAHFGKRLVEIVDHGAAGIELHFKDGTQVVVDCVIGADGVHSPTRKFLLGADHPATAPKFTNTVAYRGLIPMEKAREAIGAEYAENALIWCGTGQVIMTYPISFGTIMNVVAIETGVEKWDHTEWVIPADAETLANSFNGLSETPSKIVSLLQDAHVSCWSMWDMIVDAPYYSRGNICMMGDGAHASTPYQGQGAGQATEDALVLTELLGRITSKDQIPAAFQAYDVIRRPRTQKVILTSREAGDLLSGRVPEVGNDRQKIRERLATRMLWMWDKDMNEQVQEAVKLMEAIL